MKVCIIICVVAFAVLTAADEGELERLRKATEACNADPATALSEADLNSLKSGQNIDEAKFGPHVRCLGVKLNLLDANGVVNKSFLKEVVSRDVKDESKVDEIVSRCSEPKATPEGTALRIFKCLTLIKNEAAKKRQQQ